MTDKETGRSPKVPAARESRRHSPLPLVIVVALPIVTVLLRLPIWVTLIVLIVETVLLVFSPHLREKRVSDPKKAWLQLVATFSRLQSAHAALRQSPADAAARLRFARLEAECLSLLGGRAESDWGADSGYVTRIRKEIAELSASVPGVDAAPESAESPEAVRLKELWRQGVMSEAEFQMFSGRLKALATEKACGLLEALAGYQLQCRNGALKEEDFHAAVRGLLDRLDSVTEAGAPVPAASQSDQAAGS